MPKNNWSEKRRNVRVNIEMRARIRVIGSEEMEFRRESAPSINDLVKFLSVMEEKPDPVIAFLVDSISRVGEKIDRIAESINAAQTAGILKVVRTIDLSGSGMSFILDGSIDKGQRLDISLDIEGFALGSFQLFGEVVHTKPYHGKERDYTNVGVKFVQLSEEEQEALISYAFYLQRKAIRQHRKTEGDEANVATDSG